MIQFLLNNQLKVVDGINPSMSILDYLRLQEGKTGTKEGCASGDCGACTVVIAEVNSDQPEQLNYKAVNACITPIATAAGKQLISVEDLKHDDMLHPVQQAMVDTNGSQCGFCTPGFVMSLFAWSKNSPQDNRHHIEEALGGNLCRCTGYGPIVEAAQKIALQPVDDQFQKQQQQTIQKLQQLAVQQKSSPGLSFHNGTFHMPSSESELQLLLENTPNGRLIAGGTDLCLDMTQHLKHYPELIYLGNVRELKQVTEHDNTLEIGAAATYSECRALLTHHFPALNELLDRLGSKQIRNQGTIGGNIANASPIGDMPPVLIALNAEIVLCRGQQQRTLAVEDFFIDYKQTALQQGEYIARIRIPLADEHSQFKVYKISKRFEDDISAVCGAFHLTLNGPLITDARIAFGGMAAIPKRASHCEQSLIGQPLNQHSINQAKQAFDNDYQPISDVRASSEYRMQVSKNLLQRLLWESDNQQILRVTQDA